ncbi:hypothetical protein [Nitrososphaera viennensis]|uniref:Uncharacterized protein n=2 Tax=Nitrososphaera viennensis TaxID=1034015 RepID=A0A060HIC8_9ARCH|nr:hypothetical protein [Nitrososphaera viennensis]AIC15060.1 hypothetical protein NVIE_0861 [Nitrososphaera viennensis EN76]UVS69989.1 hypothetical protein NWT39_04180 [Nitrososphaera viennensis]
MSNGDYIRKQRKLDFALAGTRVYILALMLLASGSVFISPVHMTALAQGGNNNSTITSSGLKFSS